MLPYLEMYGLQTVSIRRRRRSMETIKPECDHTPSKGDALSLQNEVVEALMRPDAYDEKPGHIELIQTHISFVFLTRKFAYKVKKAVNLGFLDFTTLEKRRFFCEKELQLNRRLCGDMYLEVVPIRRSDSIKIKGEGETIEYALKMRRIPGERIMSRLLEEDRVDKNLIDNIAEIIAKFHSKAETNERIKVFGSLAVIEANWRENFDQTHEFIGRTISSDDFQAIRAKVEGFMRRNFSLFEKRVEDGWIRDCHGDVHSGNIFVADKIYIFDAIEFNERFRYSDATADVAFLAMDLDFKARSDLSDFFVERYIKYSGDRDLAGLLPFYKCYRAYVRGKVISFRLNDPNLLGREKSSAVEDAKAYFELAASYAKIL